MQCVYCPDELGEDTKPAHVIPAAFSGRKASPSTACNACNEAIGKAEEALWDLFKDLSGNLGTIRPDKGGKRKKARPVVVTLPNGGRVSLSGGLPTPLRSPPRRTTDGFVVRSPASLAVVAEQLVHLLRRTRQTPEDLRAGRATFEGQYTTEFMPAQRFPITIKDGEHSAAIAKMPLELLAFHQPNLVRESDFETLRKAVRFGNGPLDVRFETSTGGSGLCTRGDLPGAAHLVEVWSTGGPVIGLVRLFQCFQWTVVLAKVCRHGPFRAAYAVNPLSGEDVLDVAEKSSGPFPANWPERTVDQQVLTEWSIEFHRCSDSHLQRTAISAMTWPVIEKWAMTAGRVITPEDHRALATEVAKTFTRAMFRLDDAQLIPDDELDELYKLVEAQYAELEKKEK